MKKILCLLVGAMFLMGACDEREIPIYDSWNYIQFVEPYTDSSTISFFFYGDVEQIEVPVEVELLGNLFVEDQPFVVELVPELSTATKEHIELPEYYTFRKGLVKDTIHLVLNTPGDEEVRMVLRIPGNGENLLPGENDYMYKIIHLSTAAIQPEWWDEDVEDTYLGTYSSIKYQLLIEVTGEGDWTNFDPSTRRAYALQLKYYLREMEDAGTPVMDGDVYMSVTVIG